MSKRNRRKVQSLADYLETSGTSQTELAKRLGISVSSVSCYLLGKRQPRLSLALRISRETGVPVERLVA